MLVIADPMHTSCGQMISKTMDEITNQVHLGYCSISLLGHWLNDGWSVLEPFTWPIMHIWIINYDDKDAITRNEGDS